MRPLAPLLLVLVPARARAADPRDDQARAACESGDLDRGVRLLSQLLGETGHPNYLYNLARCYHVNGKPALALEHYREYRAKAGDIPAEEREEVDKFIRELERQQTPPPRESSAPIVVTTSAAAPAARGHWMRPAGLTVAGAGGAALVAGVLVTLRMKSIERQLDGRWQGADLVDGTAVHGDLDRGNVLHRWQVPLYAAGGVGLAGGLAMYLLAPTPGEGRTARSWLVWPMVAATQVGAGGSLRF